MKWSDIKGVFKVSNLKVKTITPLPEGHITIELDSESLQWRPGEHALFTLPGKTFSGRKWRAFSIASTPEEGVVRIGTRAANPPSGFKSALYQLKTGDTVTLHGPFGWFTKRDDTSPVVLIAGGTGITAASAVLAEAKNNTDKKIHLVHLAPGYHLYQDTLENYARCNVDLHFLHDREVSTPVIDDLAVEYGNKAYYYVSGPPCMNRAVIKRLRNLGIKKKQIIVDAFFGY